MANRRKAFSATKNEYISQVVQEHPDAVIHDRSSVAAHQKEVAWSAILGKFNGMPGVSVHSLPDLKKHWENMKITGKATAAVIRKNMFKTGGGPPTR